MPIHLKVTEWLEKHWVTPSYAGWLVLMFTMFFFGAAINTMAGWLYVISGVSFSLLLMAAILPSRSPSSLKIDRQPINPVSVGEHLTIELTIKNPTKTPISLLQIIDLMPQNLGHPDRHSIDLIPAHSRYNWIYYQPTQQRGVFCWEEVQIRTGWPLGLFYCRRSRTAKAKAIVYPIILPLTTCPILEAIGQEKSDRLTDGRQPRSAQEGLTRTLRPYRQGDPTRLIHWKSSARHGELLVRELENIISDREAIICLDSSAQWIHTDFEQAVTVAASLYFYANRYQYNVKLWTATTDLVHGNRLVMETLAAVKFSEKPTFSPPKLPLIWLTQNHDSVTSLPEGSRWIWWPTDHQKQLTKRRGLIIDRDRDLQQQLQASWLN